MYYPLYIFFISAILGVGIRIVYKCFRFREINKSTLVGSLKIAGREQNKIAIRSGIITLLVIIRAYIFFELNNQYGSLGNRIVGVVILFGFIPLAYYSVQALFGKIHLAKDVVDSLQHFSLYLRPFEADNSRESKWLEKKICITFNNFCKLYAIGDPNAILPPIGAETLYATNDSWKESVHLLMKRAKVILLRMGASEGSVWELNDCIVSQFQYKTIFIATKIDEIYSIREKLAEDSENLKNIASVDTAYAIYYNALDNKWQYMQVRNSRDIRNLCEMFKRSCPEYRELYHLYKEQKKSLLYDLRSEKIPESVKEIKFELGLVLNPVMYMYANHWNWKFWIIPMMIYMAIPIFLYTGHTLLSCVCVILFMWLGRYAARISWLSRIWPDMRTYEDENAGIRLLMFDYLKGYFIFVAIMTAFIWVITHL